MSLKKVCVNNLISPLPCAAGCVDGPKKRKACKDCTCGLAEELEEESAPKNTQPITSSCGSVSYSSNVLFEFTISSCSCILFGASLEPVNLLLGATSENGRPLCRAKRPKASIATWMYSRRSLWQFLWALNVVSGRNTATFDCHLPEHIWSQIEGFFPRLKDFFTE